MNKIQFPRRHLARAIGVALLAVGADAIGVGLIYLGAWISVRLGGRGSARSRR